jgi:glycosyl-4,4'-diaponeurosporenoate acyltransferase
MPIKLPLAWIVILNIAGWPVIHLSIGWAFSHRQTVFNLNSWLFRSRRWEQRWFAGVRQWKHLLPDAAPWFRGFPKKTLKTRDPNYLNRFVQETCRGELAHWAMMLAVILFFAFNPPWADAVMVGYAIVANLPCIITQRFNRIRLMRVIAAINRAAREASNLSNAHRP